MLWYEAQLVRERVNRQIATETVMIDTVLASILAPKGKGGRELLKKALRRLERG